MSAEKLRAISNEEVVEYIRESIKTIDAALGGLYKFADLAYSSQNLSKVKWVLCDKWGIPNE